MLLRVIFMSFAMLSPTLASAADCCPLCKGGTDCDCC
jgi:hypothetical protein